MSNITRRLFLRGAGGLALAGFGSYALAIEPGFRLEITRYDVTPPYWPAELTLKAAVLADIHASEPWMPASRVRSIAEAANALTPDIIFLLGDFNGGVSSRLCRPVMPEEWGQALSILRAPLGVYAVLGNHDWSHGPLPNMPPDDAHGVRSALENAGAIVLENDSVSISKAGQAFWVAGLADQLVGPRSRGWRSAEDLRGALDQIKDRAPVILLAHEPDIFRRVPDRVSLTLCGHTHGGQVNLPFIGSPLPYLPTHIGAGDFVYGHIVENGRHMIISGGLGASQVPVRFLCPPEIVEVTIGRGLNRVGPQASL